MTSFFKRLGPSELLPRYIFAESLFARRRVLEVGAVASTLGESAAFLVERGARQVVACDADEVAVAEAQKTHGSSNLKYSLDVFESFEPKSFDFIAVADWARFARAPELLSRLLRLLAPDGYVMGGLRNPAGLSLAQVVEPEIDMPVVTYGQLLDVLSPHFRHIDVATQTPMLGYQLCFQSLETARLDRTLSEDSEAGHFVVLAGHSPLRGVDAKWVQLAPAPLAFTQTRLADFARRAREWQERAEKLKKALEVERQTVAEKSVALQEKRLAFESLQIEQSKLQARLDAALDKSSLELERNEWALRLRRLESENHLAQERLAQTEQRAAEWLARYEEAEKARRELGEKVLVTAETARLERARHEQLLVQVNESHQRLEEALKTAQLAQEEASVARLSLDKKSLALDRALADLDESKRDLQAQKDSELRWASQQSSTLERLEKALKERDAEEGRRRQAEESRMSLEAELERARRHAQTETQRLQLLWAEREAERGRNAELRAALDASAALQASMEAEWASDQARVNAQAQELEEFKFNQKRLEDLNHALEDKVASLLSSHEEADRLRAHLDERESQWAQERRQLEDESLKLRKSLEDAERQQAQMKRDLESLSAAAAEENSSTFEFLVDEADAPVRLRTEVPTVVSPKPEKP